MATSRPHLHSARVPPAKAGDLARRPPGLLNTLVRLYRARFAAIGVILVLLFALSAILAGWIAPYDPDHQDITAALQGPSAFHWLGTDDLGRDILSRVIYGGRVSLEVGIVAVGLALVVGVGLGLIAGYWGNSLVDLVIMRLMDALLAFPALILALAIVGMLGPSRAGEFPKAIWAIGIVTIPAYARLTHGQVLSARERDYVLAARAVGAPPVRVMLWHILPNITAALIVQSSLGVATAILTEAALSFLGLGVQPPTPSWGSMLNAGRGYLDIDPWLVFGPGLAIFLTVLGLNFLGDGLRDVLDPRLKGI
ncbi:MAG TPA: ABC transporter permease [Anaerolineae bacterium]